MERAKLASCSLEETRLEEDASASFRELETRFEEHSRMLESRLEEDLNPSIKHLETRLEEHKNTLDAPFGDLQLSWLEARFDEQRQLLEMRFAEHKHLETRFEEHRSSVSTLEARLEERAPRVMSQGLGPSRWHCVFEFLST